MTPDPAWLFHPLAPDDLLRNFPQQQWLHLKARGPDYYAGLFDRDALLALLWAQEADLAERAYAFRDGQTVYLPQRDAHDPWGWLQEQYRCGATLVVNAVSHQWLPLAALCDALSRWAGTHVTANAYWTPPGAQGFGEHFDVDDTLFLQLEGSKHWKLWHPVVELPVMEQLEGVHPGALGAPAQLTLEPGDLLYLPRGFVHTPAAGQEGSLHLTLGMRHVLWRDVLTEAASVLACHDGRWLKPARPDDAVTLDDLVEAVSAMAVDPAHHAALARRVRDGRAVKPLPDTRPLDPSHANHADARRKVQTARFGLPPLPTTERLGAGGSGKDDTAGKLPGRAR